MLVNIFKCVLLIFITGGLQDCGTIVFGTFFFLCAIAINISGDV